MKDSLKFSFVMPGYKCDDHIFRAIESILDQDYQNYEIIPVLNGEWETKAQLITKLKERYGDKIELVDLQIGNLGNADNVGFEYSSGDIISHLQSDLYLMPGALRNWVEAFEDHPESKIVYSGYKLVSPNPLEIYYSNPYDRYHLECEPFIDGASPVRREAWKKWSTDLKSLVDWDWSLSVATEDTKPHYIKEPLYYAELPKPGGLSDDSSSNWVARRRAVQAKHDIPDRKICVTSFVDPQLALHLAKMIDADFRVHPGVKEHTYRLIYMYGFMCDEEELQRSTSVFFQHFGHKVIHWIGQDIASLCGTWNLTNAIHYCDMVLNRVDKHWVTTRKSADILKWMHLDPEEMYLPVEVDGNKDKIMAISVNDYGLADHLKKSMPDQEIRVNDLNCYITVHFDDRVTNVTHSLARGNHVISNQQYPYAYFIEGYTNVPELRKFMVHTIRRIIKTKPVMTNEEINHYKSRLNVQNFKRKLEKIAAKEINKYARLEDIAPGTRSLFDA